MWKPTGLALFAVLTLACGSSPPRSDSPATTAKAPGKVVVTDTVVETLDPVAFVGDTAELTPSSSPILDAVASTLEANPTIKSIIVHAYVAEAGDKAAQQEIADHRARTVLDYLVTKQVAAERLQAMGTVEAAGSTPRVAFELTKRD